MINSRTIKYDGSRNVHGDLTFYFSGHGRSVSILISTVRGKKKATEVKIYREPNHHRPHVHIDAHDASFDIDTGKMIVGKCDSKTQALIKRWIVHHRSDLNQL